MVWIRPQIHLGEKGGMDSKELYGFIWRSHWFLRIAIQHTPLDIEGPREILDCQLFPREGSYDGNSPENGFCEDLGRKKVRIRVSASVEPNPRMILP